MTKLNFKILQLLAIISFTGLVVTLQFLLIKTITESAKSERCQVGEMIDHQDKTLVVVNCK